MGHNYSDFATYCKECGSGLSLGGKHQNSCSESPNYDDWVEGFDKQYRDYLYYLWICLGCGSFIGNKKIHKEVCHALQERESKTLSVG